MARVDGVGVAFCGGGFRSFAEVAALEDMEREQLKVGAVAGTSMGSIVCALVAAGLPSSRIAELLLEMDQRVVDEGVLKNMGLKVLNFIGSNGMVNSDVLERFARDTLTEAGVTSLSDLVMPFAIPAVDAVSGDLCVFTNDEELFASEDGGWICLTGDLDLARCVACSASYPLVITPTEYLGRSFIDGGCRMNLPTPLFVRSQVDAVVGIGMMRRQRPLESLSPWDIALRTMACGANQLDRYHSQAADVYVNLPVSGDDAFQAGTGRQMIEEAREMLREHPVNWSAARPSPLTALKRAAVDAFSRAIRPGFVSEPGAEDKKDTRKLQPGEEGR